MNNMVSGCVCVFFFCFCRRFTEGHTEWNATFCFLFEFLRKTQQLGQCVSIHLACQQLTENCNNIVVIIFVCKSSYSPCVWPGMSQQSSTTASIQHYKMLYLANANICAGFVFNRNGYVYLYINICIKTSVYLASTAAQTLAISVCMLYVCHVQQRARFFSLY